MKYLNNYCPIIQLEVVHKMPTRLGGSPHGMLVNKASHSSMMDNQRLPAKPFPNTLKYDAQETGELNSVCSK